MTLGKYSSLVLRNYYFNVIGMLPCSQDGEYKLRNCAEKKFSCSHLFHKVIHRITRLIHILPYSHTQFKKVFSTVNKEIHTACAKKKSPLFLARNTEPQNGLLRDFMEKNDLQDRLKHCLSKLYPKFGKVSDALKTASTLCFTEFLYNEKILDWPKGATAASLKKKKFYH